jgi:ABC-type amino acid transport system permease subunit
MGKERLMAEGKGFLESLLDFSFRDCVTTNNRKFLYGLHLLVGLIAAVAIVVVGFQTSPTQGLINLIGALVGFFFWILYVRIALEFLLDVFRIAEAASPSTNVREER